MPRPTRGSACSGGVTFVKFLFSPTSPLLLYFGEPAPPLATVSQVIIGLRVCDFPNGIATLSVKPPLMQWLSPMRTSSIWFPLRIFLLYHIFFLMWGKRKNIFKKSVKIYPVNYSALKYRASEIRIHSICSEFNLSVATELLHYYCPTPSTGALPL